VVALGTKNNAMDSLCKALTHITLNFTRLLPSSRCREIVDVKFNKLLKNANLSNHHHGSNSNESWKEDSMKILPDGSVEVVNFDLGDSIIRNMIKMSSGVEFRTERLNLTSQVYIVLFQKRQAAEVSEACERANTRRVNHTAYSNAALRARL